MADGKTVKSCIAYLTKNNFAWLSSCRYYADRTQNMPGLALAYFGCDPRQCAQSALDFSCSVRSHFFCERILNIWNRLPVDSTDFGSLHRFRNSLDAIDDTILVDV